MQTYTIPPYTEETHRVIQDVPGKGEHEAISVWGDIACESCDYILANEGQTISIGHACRRCGTKVVRFDPLKKQVP